jgi:hypothetical protein
MCCGWDSRAPVKTVSRPASARACLGLRRQRGSGDGAFERARLVVDPKTFHPCESGVALRFPPQSKTRSRDDRM